MRQITIKEFHQNMWEEIKNLPCEVTRNNVPIFKVQSVTVGELKELPEKNSKKISELGTTSDVAREMGFEPVKDKRVINLSTYD